MTRTIPGRNFTQRNVRAGFISTLSHRLDNPSIPKKLARELRAIYPKIARIRPVSPSIPKISARIARYLPKIARIQAGYPPRGK